MLFIHLRTQPSERSANSLTVHFPCINMNKKSIKKYLHCFNYDSMVHFKFEEIEVKGTLQGDYVSKHFKPVFAYRSFFFDILMAKQSDILL